MTLGLPAHLAPIVVRRSFAASQHVLALTLLAIALVMALVFQASEPTASLWLPIVAFLPAIGLLAIADRVGTAPWSLSYLAAGGVGAYLYALGMLSEVTPVQSSDGFSFLAVKVALIMVGGVTLGIVFGILDAVAGYVTAEFAIGLAQAQTGASLHFDIPTFVILVATVGVICALGANSSRQMWALPRLQRAAHDDQVAALRYRIEVNAAALMHDTVLNHLAAIAESPADTLDPRLRQQIREDVDALNAEEWLSESTEKTASDGREVRSGWQTSGLFTAIREARLMGLHVTTSGDLAAVARLDSGTSAAVGLAAKQCLVNVLKHSGSRDAEVSVYGSDSEISVMVVDGGCGFTESTAGTDRLGLRSSVRKRIELVGGHVEVWSTPGQGTSIMIRVPTARVANGPHPDAAKAAP